MSGKMSDWAEQESSDEEEETEKEMKPSPQAIGGDVSSASAEPDVATAPVQSRRPVDESFWIYVGNLTFSADENLVGSFFVDGGCSVKNVEIAVDETGKAKGFAFVEFADAASLEKACEANGCNLGGRAIKVDIHTKRRSDKGRRDREKGAGDRDRDRRGTGRGGGARGPPRERDVPEEPAWGRKEVLAPRSRESVESKSERPPRQSRPTSSSSKPEAPAVRPRIVVLPRSLPVEFRKPASASDIFGDGKARDAAVYEEEKSKKVVEVTAATANLSIEHKPSTRVAATPAQDSSKPTRQPRESSSARGPPRDSKDSAKSHGKKQDGREKKDIKATIEPLATKPSSQKPARPQEPSTVPATASKEKSKNIFDFLVDDDDDEA